MRKSLGTKKKREAVARVSEIIVAETQRCPVPHECKSLTLEHAGAEVTIIGENAEHELALAQGFIKTKFTTKKIKDVLKIFCQEKMADDSWTAKTAAENKRIIDHFIKHTGNVTTAKYSNIEGY